MLLPILHESGNLGTILAGMCWASGGGRAWTSCARAIVLALINTTFHETILTVVFFAIAIAAILAAHACARALWPGSSRVDA